MAFQFQEAPQFPKFNKETKEQSYFIGEGYVNMVYGIYVKVRERDDKLFEKFIKDYRKHNWKEIERQYFL